MKNDIKYQLSGNTVQELYTGADGKLKVGQVWSTEDFTASTGLNLPSGTGEFTSAQLTGGSTNSLGGSIADQQNTLIQDFVDQFGQQAYNDLVSNDLPFTTDNLNAGPQRPNDIVWNFPDTSTQQNLTDTQLFTNTSPNTIAGSNGQGYQSTQTTSNPSAVNSPSTSGGGQTNTPQTLSSGTLTSSNTAIDNKNKLAGILQTQGNAMLNNLLGSNQSQLDSALYNLNSQLVDTGKLYTNPQNLYSTIASIQKRNRVTTDTTRVASRKYDMAIRQQPSLLG